MTEKVIAATLIVAGAVIVWATWNQAAAWWAIETCAERTAYRYVAEGRAPGDAISYARTVCELEEARR